MTKLLASCFAVALLLLSCRSAAAQETRDVVNRDGEVIFQLNFYGTGQGSTANFTEAQMNAVEEAAQYWVDILKANGTMPEKRDADGNIVLDENGNVERQPVVFNVFYDGGINMAGNASAGPNGYYESLKDGYNLSLAEALMVDGVYVDTVGGGHATINVGSGWNATSGNQSQSGRAVNDLTPVIIHELGHALGISTSATYEIDEYIPYDMVWLFPETISRYDSHLRDNNGNSPLTKPGTNESKTIGYDETEGGNANTIFDMGDPNTSYESENPSQATFVGRNTLELWYGTSYDNLTDSQKRFGVPVQGYTYGSGWNYPYDWQWIYNPGGTLSHIDTTNSLMSWQAYRNYPGFIEIELAVMQDLGYSVERRNFFGKSFYVDGNGETIYYNSSSFAYWDAATQSYDRSKPNDALYAIGTHLFASNLNIYQNGTTWIGGAGSAGVRIDGSANQFTLARAGTIRTEGTNGIGILVAYGKDHTVTLQQGSQIYAADRTGMAVSFDFGIPTLGDARGSYYYETIEIDKDTVITNYLEELDGPLVKDFNISGTITAGTLVSSAPDIIRGGDYTLVDRRGGTVVINENDGSVVLLNVSTTSTSINMGVTTLEDQYCDVIAYSGNNIILDPIRSSQKRYTITEIRNESGVLTGRIITHEDGSTITLDGNNTIVSTSGNYYTNNSDRTVTVVENYKGTGYTVIHPEDDDDAMYGDNRYRIVSHDHCYHVDSVYYHNCKVIFDDEYYVDGADRVIIPAQPEITISGQGGAIYIAGPEYDMLTQTMKGGAHVERINIMQGASIQGDIISEYYDDQGRGTTLTFGLKADGNGRATSAADPDFKFLFSDNINYYLHYETRFLVMPDGVEERGGNYDYDEELGYYLVGDGLGRYLEVDDDATDGKIDLHFVGGYTEFLSNRANVNSVLIDRGATLTLSAERVYDAETETVGYDAPKIYAAEGFTNNGRFSGEGAVMVGAERLYEWDDLFGLTLLGWAGNGTFTNEGTISPGSDNGEGIGIIVVNGDFVFTKNSVYEVTIGGESEVRYHSGILPNGNFINQDGEYYYQFRHYDEDSDEWLVWDIFRPNTTAIQGTGNDVIVVSGNTTMGGTLKINVLADSVFGNETTTHTIIQSGSFTEGSNFDKIEYDQRFLAITNVHINPRNPYEAQVSVVRELDFFQKRGKTHNEIAVGKAVDNSLFADPRIAFSLGHNSGSDTDVRDMLRQIGAVVRANGAMLNLWNPSEFVFNRIGYGNGQMNTDDRGRINWDRIKGRTHRMLGQSHSRRSGSVWADMIHTSFDAESDGNSDEYKFSRSGFMIGGEWNLSTYSAVGAIAAYTDGTLRQSGDKIESDDYMLGLYFVCAPFNEIEIKTYIGLGFQEYDMKRYVRNANIVYDGATGIDDRYVSDTQGNSFNFSFEVARPWMLHPTFILRPTLGVDVQHLWQDSFSENNLREIPASYGSNLYALRYSKMHYDRALLRVGFSSETSGFRGGIRMRTFYVTNFGDDAYPTSKAAFKAGGGPFEVRGVKLSRNYLNLGIGANLWLDGERTSSLFFDYDADIYMGSRKNYNHNISAGFVQNF